MCLTDLDLDLPEVADHEEQAPRPEPHPADGRYAGVAWGPHSIRSRISRTRSIGVCGCRNANLATVSPSHADGGMKAIWSCSSWSAHAV